MSQTSSGQPALHGTPTTQDRPIACSLTDTERAVRREENRAILSECQQVQELPHGYALRFPGDAAWAQRVLAVIAAERVCCPCFIFELVFEPAQGPLWLHLRGPAGTKEVVAALLAEG